MLGSLSGHLHIKNAESGFLAFAKALPEDAFVITEATGSYNMAIGSSALSYSTIGDALVNVGNNNIAIGANAQIPVNGNSNQMVLGGAPSTSIGGVSTATTRTIINGIVNSSAGAPNNSNSARV